MEIDSYMNTAEVKAGQIPSKRFKVLSRPYISVVQSPAIFEVRLWQAGVRLILSYLCLDV